MRTFIISFAAFLIISCFAGCGNDNSTGTNNNPPATRDSLIASFDSLTASNFIAPYYNGYGFGDTLTIKKFRVSFQTTANLDSTSGSYLSIHITHDGDTTDFYASEKFGMSINNLTVNDVFMFNVSFPYFIELFLKFGFDPGFPTFPFRTIKVFNFKLYAILD